MNQKPDLPPEQREILDRFIVDLPKILAGADPFKWAASYKDRETVKCSEPGCEWYQYQTGLCFDHYRARN